MQGREAPEATGAECSGRPPVSDATDKLQRGGLRRHWRLGGVVTMSVSGEGTNGNCLGHEAKGTGSVAAATQPRSGVSEPEGRPVYREEREPAGETG